MQLPTVKFMVSRGFSQDEATKIRELMAKFRRRHPLGNVRPTVTLEKINAIMDGTGVEFITQGTNQKSPHITYVNMGDAYDTTVLFYNGNFHIGCWGFIVEQGNYETVV